MLALRYHCDPLSELNQLRGAQADSAYTGHLQATLARLESCGVFLGTMNELLATLDAPTAPAAASGEPRRYLTVTDVVNNPALAAAPHAQLTDAAIDYLKQKDMTLPNYEPELNDVFENKMLVMDAAGYPLRNLGNLDVKMFGNSEGSTKCCCSYC